MRILWWNIRITNARDDKIREKWKTEAFKQKHQRASKLVAKIDAVLNENFHLLDEDGRRSPIKHKDNAVVNYYTLLNIWNIATYVKDDI